MSAFDAFCHWRDAPIRPTFPCVRRLLHPVCLALAILGIGTPVLAHARPQPTRVLTVTVVDQTGAAIVGARVTVSPVSPTPPAEARSDGRGEAQFTVSGPVALRVEADGFMPYVVTELALRASRVRHVARLRLAGYVEDIVVRRDPRTNRTDRRGDGFSTILGPEDLADLPDDPDMLREWLAQLAGPGVRFRIDGFGSGRFPTKAEIARVRIAWNTFGAEFHDAGGPVVDITTRPDPRADHVRLGHAGDGSRWRGNRAGRERPRRVLGHSLPQPRDTSSVPDGVRMPVRAASPTAASRGFCPSSCPGAVVIAVVAYPVRCAPLGLQRRQRPLDSPRVAPHAERSARVGVAFRQGARGAREVGGLTINPCILDS